MFSEVFVRCTVVERLEPAQQEKLARCPTAVRTTPAVAVRATSRRTAEVLFQSNSISITGSGRPVPEAPASKHAAKFAEK